jgi:hypothetical protein
MSRIPQINNVPNPVVESIEPPVVNGIPVPPVVTNLDQPIVDIPSFVPPSYEPPQLTPDAELPVPGYSNGRDPVESPEEPNRDLSNTGTEVGPRPEVILPNGSVVPLPYGREVALAGTTAVAATSAALIGKSLVEWMVKRFRPIVKKIILKTKEAMGNRLTHLEEQQYFELEGRVAKQLKADAKAEKMRQLEEHSQRQRQHKH